MWIAPAVLGAIGAAFVAAALALSLTSLHANPGNGDPMIQCGSLIARQHFPNAYYTDPGFPNHKCGGQRVKREHRVLLVGALGLGGIAGAFLLHRRDVTLAADVRRDVERELAGRA